MNATLLEVQGLNIQFGRAKVVQDLDIVCMAESITVLTGPNGSGKTSVLNALNGLLPLQADRFVIAGRGVGRLSWTPYRAFRYGIRRTFQIPRNWPSLDLLENLMMASGETDRLLYARLGEFLPGVSATRSPRTLSLGQRRTLEVLRLVLGRRDCKVALLDEPLSGLDRVNAQKVKDAVSLLRDSGAALLIVDHEPDKWPERNVTIELALSSLNQRKR